MLSGTTSYSSHEKQRRLTNYVKAEMETELAENELRKWRMERGRMTEERGKPHSHSHHAKFLQDGAFSLSKVDGVHLRDDSELNLRDLGLGSDRKRIEVTLSNREGSSSRKARSSERKQQELENTFGKQARSSGEFGDNPKPNIRIGSEHRTSPRKKADTFESKKEARTLEDESPKPRRLFQERRKLNLSCDTRSVNVGGEASPGTRTADTLGDTPSETRIIQKSHNSSMRREIKMDTTKKFMESGILEAIDMKHPQIKILVERNKDLEERLNNKIRTLEKRLENCRESVVLEAEIEKKLADKKEFYEKQIEDLERLVSHLNNELMSKASVESRLKQENSSLQKSLRFKEEEYKRELFYMKNEVDKLKKLTEFFSNPEKMEKKDLHIVELETEVSMHRNLLQESSRVKTELETKLEVMDREYQQISRKVTAEVEERFKKEVRELGFIVESLKRENETLFQYKLQKRFSLEEKSSGRGKENGNFKDSEELLAAIELLKYEKFEVEEQRDWALSQLKALQFSGESRRVMESSVCLVNEKRCQNLKSLALFWKKRTHALCQEYYSSFKALRDDNQRMKSDILSEQRKIFKEIEKTLLTVTRQFKQEKLDMQEKLFFLEEKDNSNQSKIAELRSRLKRSEIRQKSIEIALTPRRSKCGNKVSSRSKVL